MNSYDRQWCVNLFNELIQMPIARPFLRPVDPVADGASDYLTIIQTPMDFSTVSAKLRAKEYSSTIDFIDDLKLIVANAVQYNGSDSMIADFARDLQKHFLWEFGCKSSSAGREWFSNVARVVAQFEELARWCPLKYGRSERNRKRDQPDVSHH
jgi:hypothetical protein